MKNLKKETKKRGFKSNQTNKNFKMEKKERKKKERKKERQKMKNKLREPSWQNSRFGCEIADFITYSPYTASLRVLFIRFK